MIFSGGCAISGLFAKFRPSGDLRITKIVVLPNQDGLLTDMWKFKSDWRTLLIVVAIKSSVHLWWLIWVFSATPPQLSNPSDLPCSVSGLCGSMVSRAYRVSFGISVSNFMCMSFVAVGRCLFIFSYIIFKMAAWWPYLIFQFLDSNFNLA